MGQIVPFFVQTCILSEDQRASEKKNVAALTDVDKQQVDGPIFYPSEPHFYHPC